MATSNEESIVNTEADDDLSEEVLLYYENIPWKPVDRKELYSCHNQFIPKLDEDPTQTHALRLIEDLYKPYPERAVHIPPVNKKPIKAVYIPGIEGCPTIYCADFSQLTKEESMRLYHFLGKMKNKVPLTNRETEEYKKLFFKASLDFTKFQNLIAQQWISTHYSRTKNVAPSIIDYINQAWESKTSFCLNLYPPTYTTKSKSDVPLTLNDPNFDYSVLDFQKVQSVRGKPPKMSIPSSRKRFELVKDLSELCRIKPYPGQENTSSQPITCTTLPVSLDHVASDFLKQDSNIDVVISVSAIKTIVDCYSRQKNWILPVNIKKVEVPQKDGKGNITNYAFKNIVTIDKKLPANCMSVHDKNVLHAKQTAKWALIMNSNPQLLRGADSAEFPSSSFDSISKRELKSYGDCLTDAFDDFGLDPKSRNEPNQGRKTVMDSADKIATEQKSFVSIKSKRSSSGNIFNDIKTSQTEQTECQLEDGEIPCSPNDSMSKDKAVFPRRKIVAKRFQRQFNPCHTYRHWDLHKSMNSTNLKGEHRPLHILVRNKTEGNLIHLVPNYNTVLDDEVYVSSKVEFLPEYGASKMTKSELVREYVDLYMRPHAKLVRVRSIGYTQELMICEVKTLSEIKDVLIKMGVQVHKVFDPLYAVLTSLIDQPEGKYILNHTSRMNSFAQLLLASADGTSLNLHSHFHKLQEEEVKVPPPQIDPFVLTGIHHHNKQPPATLRPGYDVNRAIFLQKPNRPSKLLSKSTKRRNKRKDKANQSMTTGKSSVIA